ncbi:MAG TPA: hypothetical protein VHK69_17860 [Chitinophagaceae bacterium]|jgi:hypothetical protein|nr:hypothetical protein [Chitinophagaceae bacterium]
MKRVTLLFRNEKDLKRFYMIIEAPYVELNTRTLTLVCECTSEDIDIAIRAFSARVIGVSEGPDA